METFDELKEICRRACHERNACKEGFEAMLLAENTAELMHVWRRWWEDVYESKYADIMTERIATARGRLRREMRQSDVFVNESSERGLVIVCRPGRPIQVGGRAKCYVFGTAADVTATDHAQVYCRESGVRLTLRGYATGRVKAGNCRCYDRTLLKGTPDSVELHDQAKFEPTAEPQAAVGNVKM